MIIITIQIILKDYLCLYCISVNLSVGYIIASVSGTKTLYEWVTESFI